MIYARFAAATVIALLVCCAAPAATIFMDAAETDIYGNPLAKPAIRMRVDNRVVQQATFDQPSAAVTDLTGIRFEFDYTGFLLGLEWIDPSDPASPWYGADIAPMRQTLDGVEYTRGVTLYADNIIGSYWAARDLSTGQQWELFDVVPVGLIWEPMFNLNGSQYDPVVLFHSPATGTVDSNEGTWSLTDDDPRPQTVPEPATLTLLASLWAAAVCRRRTGRNR